MAPNVTVHFFAPGDINGTPLLEITDEDEFFKGLKLQPELYALGGWELTLARNIGFQLFDSGAVQPEVFVRFLVHAWSDTDYFWGGVLSKREQDVIHRDEAGAEEFVFGGPGPKQYMERYRLGIEQLGGSGLWNVDLANGVWRYTEAATAGRVLNRLVDEDALAADPAMPDLTVTFDQTDDSDGNPWSDTIADADGSFELPIGNSLIQTIWDLEDLADLYTVINLGTAAAPLYELNAYEAYGEDNGGNAFGAGVCLLREGVNIANQALTVRGVAMRKATHVIVQGKDDAWTTAVRPSWNPGDYVKWEKISYSRSSNLNILEKAGIRWLQRQTNGFEALTIEFVPGVSPTTGFYFPGPTELMWTGNTISLDTVADGSTHSPLDYNNADQLVTGLEMELGPAGDDTTADKVAKSWDIKVKLNHERGGNASSPNQNSATTPGTCTCGPHTHPGTSPPPFCTPGGGTTSPTACSWDGDLGDSSDWPGGYLPTGASPPSTFDINQPGFAPYKFMGSGQTPDLMDCGLVAGNTYNIEVDCGSNSQYAFYELKVVTTGPTSGTIITVLDSIYPGAPTATLFTLGGTFTIPADADSCSIRFGSTFGGWHYNEVRLDEVVAPPADPPFCIDPDLPADSPYQLPSDTVEAMIAAAIAAIPPELQWFNVTTYGALGDGETDNQDAVNAAIADLNTAGAGVLYFPAGDYHTSGGFDTITAATVIRGDGSMSFDGAEWGTRIFITNSAVDLFTLTAKINKVEHIGLHCDSGGTPTAGAAVHTDGAYLEQKTDFEDVHSRGFFYGFDIEVGAQWSMVNCQITAPKKYGVYIRNTVNNDAGDWSIVNTNLNAHAYAADAAIRVESSGGGKITNTKINMGFPAGSKFVDGISVAVSGSTQTVILNVTNCSIENVTGDGIDMSAATGSSFWKFIILDGNQFGLYGNNSGKAISLVSTDAGDLSDIYIGGNVFHTDGTARSAVQITNVDNITFSGNVLSDNFTSLYTDSGSTNITEVGSGVTAHSALSGLTSGDDHTQYVLEASTDYVDLTDGGVTSLHSHTGGGGIGEILISDTPSTPLIFADLIQNEAQDDLVYADP